MRKNKKVLSFIAYLMMLMLVVCAFSGCAAKTEEKKEASTLSLLTGSSGGLYYVIGAGLGDVANNNTDAVRISAEPSTGGSTERARLVGEGDVQLGLVTSIVGYQAYTGQGDFAEPYENLRIALAGHHGYMQIAVARDSDIKSMEDLKGKTIATGQGAGVLSLEQALAPYGLVKDRDFTAMPLNEGEFVDALKNKVVDAIAQPNGLHTAYFEELNATVGLRWLTFTEEAVASICAVDPYNVGGVKIPAGEYEGQDEEIITFSVPCIMVTSSTVPEEDIYNFVKAVFENNDDLVAVHTAGAEWIKDHPMYQSEACVPIHEGTLKYLKEQGIVD